MVFPAIWSIFGWSRTESAFIQYKFPVWISDIWTIKIFFNMFALYICSMSDLGAAGTNETLSWAEQKSILDTESVTPMCRSFEKVLKSDLSQFLTGFWLNQCPILRVKPQFVVMCISEEWFLVIWTLFSVIWTFAFMDLSLIWNIIPFDVPYNISILLNNFVFVVYPWNVNQLGDKRWELLNPVHLSYDPYQALMKEVSCCLAYHCPGCYPTVRKCTGTKLVAWWYLREILAIFPEDGWFGRLRPQSSS